MENYTQVKKIEKIIAMCMLAFAIVLVVAVYSFISLGKVRRANAEYDELLASLEHREAGLQSSVDEMSTEKYIEQQARERLGMIQDGETLYKFK